MPDTFRFEHRRVQGSARGSAEALRAWSAELSRVRSVFGRLVYLASLRDPASAWYHHYGLAHACGEDEANRVVSDSHRRAFSEWLGFPLEHQKADLELYVSGLGMNRGLLLRIWSRLAPYRQLVPTGASEVEQQLFLSDLESVLGILNSEPAAPLAAGKAAAS
jgi:hypothetical protein